MTNNDELALKLEKLATKATSGEWLAYIGGAETYAVHTTGDSRCGDVIKWPGFDGQKKAKDNAKYIAAANPANILALLAERDADKKRIAELEGKNALVAGGISAVSKLYDRIAELEARQLDVIVPPRRCFDYAALAVQERDEQWHKALHDACKRGGIKLEVGE